MALPSLIDNLAQLLAWKSLLHLSMMWWWRYLTQSNFLSTTTFAWSLALHLCFCSVRRSLYGGRKYTHTPTHLPPTPPPPTHTHTHTHTRMHTRIDLTVISNWAFQWKMTFNSDLTKQAQELIFSRKTKKLLCSCLLFNNIPLKNSISQNFSGWH